MSTESAIQAHDDVNGQRVIQPPPEPPDATVLWAIAQAYAEGKADEHELLAERSQVVRIVGYIIVAVIAYIAGRLTA
jgi:hypothetical protein